MLLVMHSISSDPCIHRKVPGLKHLCLTSRKLRSPILQQIGSRQDPSQLMTPHFISSWQIRMRLHGNTKWNGSKRSGANSSEEADKHFRQQRVPSMSSRKQSSGSRLLVAHLGHTESEGKKVIHVLKRPFGEFHYSTEGRFDRGWHRVQAHELWRFGCAKLIAMLDSQAIIG